MSKNIKVIKILSPQQVVLNSGSEDGISEGTEFLIYGLGDVLVDPDTGEDLEQLELVRGTGMVVHLQNKICTVESNEIEETPRTIKRKQADKYMYPFSSRPTEEETEIIRTKKGFKNVQLGDHARII